ncbi:DUF7524 family protein [Haloparvum sp. AD34]
MPTLPVELNRDGVYSIQAPTEFTTTEPFTVELRNRGQPVHVHLNVDDELARVAKPAATSHYVDANSITRVRVDTREPAQPTGGKLKIAAGHGSETHYVDVAVEPVPDEEQPVILDEDLAKPATDESTSSSESPVEAVADALPDRSAVPRITAAHAFVGLAVAAAILVGVLVRSTVVTLGVLVVIVAAVGALAVLQSDSRSGSP